MTRGRLATAAAFLLAFPAGAGAARAPETSPFTGAADAWAYPALSLSRSTIGLERDLKIAHEIRDQLLRSRFVNSDKVDVVVLDGTAILTGDVDTRAERSSAEQNAYEGGAARVRNRLTVRGRARFPY